MAFKEVEKEIIREANRKAQEIIDSADAEIKVIRKQSADEIKYFKQEQEKEVENLVNNYQRNIISQSEFKVKKDLLKKQSDFIEKAFNDALKRIKVIRGKKEILSQLIIQAQKSIEPYYIYVNKDDIKHIQDYEVRPIDIVGGLIAENESQTERVDLSFDTILQQIKNQYSSDLIEGISK